MTRLLLLAMLVALVAIATAALTLTLSDGAAARSALLQQVPTNPPPPPPAVPSSPVIVDPAAIAPGVPHQVNLRVGDSIFVEDAGVGCQVNTRGGRVTIECRRSGAVKGTYMSVISKRGAKLARFRSADAAKVIVGARHGGGWRACGHKARAARAGGGMCR
jgi:hypothetical protein